MGKLTRWWLDTASDYVVGVGIAIAMTAYARYTSRAESNQATPSTHTANA